MFGKHNRLAFSLTTTLVVSLFIGCGQDPQNVKDNAEEKAAEVKEDVDAVIEQAGLFIKMVDLAAKGCDEVLMMSVEEGEGYGIPGVAEGSERWGIPEEPPSELRVRRSWTSLSDAEKKHVVDGFAKLKHTVVDSGMTGAERAVYKGFCQDDEDGSYAHNLYDYYVEAHYSAFVSMGKTDMPETRMAHMGPQFLPWHRYFVLRIEADMQDVLGDPDFTLPYWNWEDCEQGQADSTNSCPKVFEESFLGSHGSCEEGETDVTGYLVDQGFEVHIWGEADETTMFNTGSLRCSTKALQRSVGCSEMTDGRLPTAEDVAGIYDRKVYDTESYDSCNTDQDVSLRQYIEGYKQDERNALCILAGCENHGLGHLYIGADMGSPAPPNDPMFFLHHANVDRLWAMWQERNRESSDTSTDYGNPEYPDDWRGAIFNFDDVRADEMFDFRALGYTYDSIGN